LWPSPWKRNQPGRRAAVSIFRDPASAIRAGCTKRSPVSRDC
jgi:hypothetical protein